jgi:apoptosis-inducing factor 3
MKGNERVIAQAIYLAPGQMKAVQVEDTKILLVRLTNGDYTAVGAICPHAGAALEQGLLCDQRILCPWHKSVFDIRTGELLEPPLSRLNETSRQPPFLSWCASTRVRVRTA